MPSNTPISAVKSMTIIRSVPFQIPVACGASFTAPSIWDAAEPYAASAANALGTVGYPLFGTGLYTNNDNANTWSIVFGSAFCGISAGFFWAAEAAIIDGYPSPRDHAFYLTIWQTAKAAGPIVGGVINLGLNAKRRRTGSVSSSTYIVRRTDGIKTNTPKASSWGGEFKAVGKLFASWRILLLLSAFFIGYLTMRVYIKTRGRIAFLSIIVVLAGTWIWATILQKQIYEADEPPAYDWFQGEFGKSYAPVFFWQFDGQAFQQFMHWLVGQYVTDLSDLSRHISILRGTEVLGQTVAWTMQSEGNANHFVSIGLNFGKTVLCLPTWIVLSELEGSHEGNIVEAYGHGSDSPEEETSSKTGAGIANARNHEMG
ncbi:hypothetical protein LZ30DRAFT_752569 [Colletotrichum cereale]|nr:hypothetical protein LZ30DRAFT_752569 [Colletotrichum cereale]